MRGSIIASIASSERMGPFPIEAPTSRCPLSWPARPSGSWSIRMPALSSVSRTNRASASAAPLRSIPLPTSSACAASPLPRARCPARTVPRPIWSNSPISSTTTSRRIDMYLQHFGLRHPPLGKDLVELWDDGALALLAERFNWLLQSPGLGMITGEPGVGKTAPLRHLTQSLNPHRYQVLYQAETDFGRIDIYRGLARALGVEPSYRRAHL